MIKVRPPAVAGAFYPGNPEHLAQTIDQLLDSAPKSEGGTPRALIVPHAGYQYSGLTAAAAYARLRGLEPRPRRIVLLGPAHRVAIKGLALPDAAGLATPLGTLPVDEEGVAALTGLPQVSTSSAPHAEEHSLEVQLPFIQRVLPGIPVVPLVVGSATAEQVAEVIERLWDREGTLPIVSSDLSHYLRYQRARTVDQRTARAILDLEAESLDTDMACGAIPVSGLLLAARRRGLKVQKLDMRNSGDTSGDRDRVVGYGAFAFISPEASA
jgi:MEMO1 family protein